MRSYLRFASVVGAVTLSAIAAAPAMAAAPLSQAGANAVTVAVAGNAQGTGDVTATNDGTSETKTGETAPQVPAPGGGFFTGGVAGPGGDSLGPGRLRSLRRVRRPRRRRRLGGQHRRLEVPLPGRPGHRLARDLRPGRADRHRARPAPRPS